MNISDVRDEHSLPLSRRAARTYLFNLAGQTSHLDSMIDPYTDLEINCRSQLSILEACRHHNPDVEDRLREHAPDLRPPAVPARRREPSARPGRRERHQQDGGRVVPPALRRRLRPARHRPAADEHLRAADARQGRAADVPRHLAPAAARGRGDPVFGDGAQRRDFNYVDDAVAAFLLAAARDEATGEVYNLGGDEVSLPRASWPSSSSSSAGAAACELVPFPADRKAIDIGDYYADYSAIERELGWRAGGRRSRRACGDARLLPRARRGVLGRTHERPVPRPARAAPRDCGRARRGDRARARRAAGSCCGQERRGVRARVRRVLRRRARGRRRLGHRRHHDRTAGRRRRRRATR